MGKQHSSFVIALLVAVIAGSTWSGVTPNYSLASRSSSTIAIVTSEGKAAFARFVREMIGAYVLTRFIADLGHTRSSDQPDCRRSQKPGVLVSQAATSPVASGEPALK